MRDYEIKISTIESSLKNVNLLEIDDGYVSQIAQYNCVRLSGVIEHAVRDCIIRSFEGKCHPRALQYIRKNINQFQNPAPNKITNLYNNIDPVLGKKIESFWTEKDEIYAAISSIVNNRNNIAHGEYANISIIQLKDWLRSVRKFCAFIEKLD